MSIALDLVENRADAPSAQALARIHQLRYDVYCVERRFLERCGYPGGQERDCYDLQSIHFAATDGDGEVLAAVRLVLDSPLGFPLERYVGHWPQRFRGVARSETAEVSRLIVAKGHRSSPVERHLVLRGLLREVYEECRRVGIVGLLAAMEAPLCRLLRRLQLPFDPAGEEIPYLGTVIPYFARVDSFHSEYDAFLSSERRLLAARGARPSYLRLEAGD